MESAVYKVHDLQERYGLSRSGAYAFARTLPPGIVMRFGRALRIDRVGLERYLANQEKQEKQEK